MEEVLAAAGRAVPPISDIAQDSEREQRTAVGLAHEGAQQAAEVGLEAEALAVETSKSVWEAIERVARETNARLIACGNAKSGFKASVPTILPNALAQRASKPVLVVPSAKAATERRRELEKG
jgi:nucleotide-binding universal stress UspA family protein